MMRAGFTLCWLLATVPTFFGVATTLSSQDDQLTSIAANIEIPQLQEIEFSNRRLQQAGGTSSACKLERCNNHDRSVSYCESRDSMAKDRSSEATISPSISEVFLRIINCIHHLSTPSSLHGSICILAAES
jgi:hypothetical protein